MVNKTKSNDKFNFDEWVDAVPKKQKINRTLLGDNEIKLKIKKHHKKEKMYHVYFTFREKILKLLDSSNKPKIIFFKHKDDDKRLLLTRSENGYAVANPNKADYFYFKSLLYSDFGLDEGIFLLDPIFHVKGKNSGSIIEIKIPI